MAYLAFNSCSRRNYYFSIKQTKSNCEFYVKKMTSLNSEEYFLDNVGV